MRYGITPTIPPRDEVFEVADDLVHVAILVEWRRVLAHQLGRAATLRCCLRPFRLCLPLPPSVEQRDVDLGLIFRVRRHIAGTHLGLL